MWTRLRWAAEDIGATIGTGVRGVLDAGGGLAGQIAGGAATLGRLVAGLVSTAGAVADAVLGGARRAGSWLALRLTPARTTAAVGLAACGLLAASQFIDYRAVEIGTPEYLAHADLGVTPLPRTGAETPEAAHGYAVVALALGATIALVLALRGRWRLGRLAATLGAVAVGIILAIDLPEGTDAGALASQYEGASPILLEGFYAELAAAGALIAAGLLAARYGRPLRRARHRQQQRGSLPGVRPEQRGDRSWPAHRSAPGPTGLGG